MLKLTSLLALSTLVIAPALASELWDLESRDVIESKATSGLFARQQDFESPNLFRRIMIIDPGVVTAATEMGRKALLGCVPAVPAPHYTAQDRLQHRPFAKHELVLPDFDDELFELDLDHDFYILDFTDEDLFERFYDDLD